MFQRSLRFKACCQILLLLGLTSVGETVDFGKVFKRRLKTSKQRQGNVDDAEANADEARTYHTSCDLELSKSLVILGEQKQQSEAALDACKKQRDKARDNVEFLTKKIEIQNESLEEGDERCNRKLEVFYLKANDTASEHESKTQELINKHSEEISELTLAHNEKIEAMTAAAEEMKLQHEFEKQERDNKQKEEIAILTQAKEEMTSAFNKERADAKLKFETAQAQHREKIEKMEKDWKYTVSNTEEKLNKKLVRVESSLKIEVESVSKKLSTCDISLSDTSRKKDSLENKYNRALKKIEVLENVTAYSLFCEEVKAFLYILKDILHGPYQKHMEDKVDRVAGLLEKAKPKLEPVAKPLKEKYDQGAEALKLWASDLFEKILDQFNTNICVHGKRVKVWETKNLDSAHISEAFERACTEPTEFLEGVGWITLVLVGFVLRRVIFRLFCALLLMPFLILILPLKLLLRSRGKNKNPSPTGKQ